MSNEAHFSNKQVEYTSDTLTTLGSNSYDRARLCTQHHAWE